MKIEELIDKGDRSAQSVRAVLNILLEAPYFYKTDDERLFLVLMRCKKAFAAFFEKFYGWELVMDENLDVHLSPVVWRNVATQSDLLGGEAPDVGMTVMEETK